MMGMFLLGFRKIDGDRWEFANEEFLRGKRGLLTNINRRRSPRTQPKSPYFGSSVRMELLGAEDELQKLRSEKHILMQEVLEMKQEHLVTIKEIDKMNCRLQSAELRQKQIMSFWAKVLRNPVFLTQLKQAKKLRDLASTMSIQRSLEQEQPNNSTHTNNSTTQQIVEYRQSFCQPDSTFVLQGLESGSETQLTDHLLQDMSDKLGIDLNVQDGSSQKLIEISEPSLSPNYSFKGKNILVSNEFSSAEEFYSKKIVLEPISPVSESSSKQDLQIGTFIGKSSEETQGLFLYSVKPEGEIACMEEFCDVDFEAGGVWDHIFSATPVVPGGEIGFSERWDYGLHSDEGFYIDKCFGSEIPLLPDMDEDGLRDDQPKSSEF